MLKWCVGRQLSSRPRRHFTNYQFGVFWGLGKGRGRKTEVTDSFINYVQIIKFFLIWSGERYTRYNRIFQAHFLSSFFRLLAPSPLTPHPLFFFADSSAPSFRVQPRSSRPEIKYSLDYLTGYLECAINYILGCQEAERRLPSDL